MRTLAELAAELNPRPEGRCLLGLSGGADSVGLLRMLLPLRDSGRIAPEAVHVNHGLRGAESDGDEAFVRELCAGVGVPLHAVKLDLRGRSDENAAREARYAAFERTLRETGISVLVLAHQREDQAETFLMRLLRGAGPEGLGGMKAREERPGYTLLRPMLGISGVELRDALRAEGIPWREDASNQEARYLRNRIRRELLPRMEEIAPGAPERIARTAGMIAAENEAMDARARELLTRCEGPEGLEAAPLRAEPEALRIRTLRLWWRRNGPRLEERELNRAQTLRLEGLLEAPRGTIINLPGGWRARREKERLRLLPPGDRTKNNRPGKEKKERGGPSA